MPGCCRRRQNVADVGVRPWLRSKRQRLFPLLDLLILILHRTETLPYITPNLKIFEKKIHSQFNEDGVILHLAECLGIARGTFFEFGIGPAAGTSIADGLEGNLVTLRERGYTGVFLDGNDYPYEAGVRCEFITALNINVLYQKHGLPDDLDFMSIDVDGQDFWIWMALDYRPKVIIIEYNGSHGIDDSMSVGFDLEFRWDWTNYQGASLMAMNKLATSKSYKLVYSNGVNAIFLRNDLLSNPDDFPYAQVAMGLHPMHGEDLKFRAWTKI